MLFNTLIIISKILLIILPLLMFVALLTYIERKVIAGMQLRRGPNVVGPLGLFQPIADGIKLLTKENPMKLLMLLMINLVNLCTLMN